MAETKLKTCFISAPAKVDTTPLRQELEARGVRWFDVATSRSVGASVLDTVRSGINDADFLCGVIPEGPVSANVLFELGLAVGRDRPALVFIDPRVELPSDLGGIAYARATLKDIEALKFHLDMFLGNSQPRANGRTDAAPRVAWVPQPSAHNWLDAAWTKLNSASEPPEETEIIRFVTELFDRFGAVTATPGPPSSMSRVDMAVWIDEIEPIAGNPLFVKVVGRPDDVVDIENGFRNLLAQSDSDLGLLVSWGERDRSDEASPNSSPLIIRFRVDEVVEQIRAGTFVPSLLERRNEAVHAVAAR